MSKSGKYLRGRAGSLRERGELGMTPRFLAL